MKAHKFNESGEMRMLLSRGGRPPLYIVWKPLPIDNFNSIINGPNVPRGSTPLLVCTKPPDPYLSTAPHRIAVVEMCSEMQTSYLAPARDVTA
jgi:hypothetical protein